MNLVPLKPDEDKTFSGSLKTWLHVTESPSMRDLAWQKAIWTCCNKTTSAYTSRVINVQCFFFYFTESLFKRCPFPQLHTCSWRDANISHASFSASFWSKFSLYCLIFSWSSQTFLENREARCCVLSFYFCDRVWGLHLRYEPRFCAFDLSKPETIFFAY